MSCRNTGFAVLIAGVALLAACSFGGGGGGTTGGDGSTTGTDTAVGLDVPSAGDTTVAVDSVGTDAIEPVDPGSSTDLSAPCEAGAQGCDGAYVLMCIDAAWQRIEPACDQGCTAGHCNTCKPGERTCDGDRILICSANGSGTELFQTCADGQCLTDPVRCAGCQPDEICNGADDDCDGQTDEDLPDQVCGQGACQGTAPACVNGVVPTCQPGTPGGETCNGQDDDCDGQVDEGVTQSCTTSCGAGTQTCSYGSWGACNGPQASAEVCDGKDNDCDGQIDEGLQCGTTGSCKEYYGCLGGCGGSDTACMQACQDDLSSTGLQQAQALQTCLQNNGCTSISDETAFQQCLADYCMDPYFQCFSGTQYASCESLVGCLNGCSTTSTCQVCYTNATYQANKDLYTLQECWATACTMCSDSSQATQCDTCINAAAASGGACASPGAKCGF